MFAANDKEGNLRALEMIDTELDFVEGNGKGTWRWEY